MAEYFSSSLRFVSIGGSLGMLRTDSRSEGGGRGVRGGVRGGMCLGVRGYVGLWAQRWGGPARRLRSPLGLCGRGF